MRVSFYLISLAILISSVFVSAVPDGNGGNGCSACWVEQRNKIQQCQNIPKGEVDEFSGLSDQQIVDKKADFPHLIPCLCALVPKVPSIIDTCNCNADDAKGLTKESIIVKDLCTNVVDDSSQPTQKPNKTDTSNTNNTTNNTTNTSNTNNNNNKPGGGTGDDSTPGDGSGDGSGYDNSTVTNTTADGSKPITTNAAVSAQWAGSLIVTLGAVVIGLVAL